MKNPSPKIKKPEEIELEKKYGELSNVQEKLAQLELELATLQAEIRAFNFRYLIIVGTKIAKLDEIEALIAEKLVSKNPLSEEISKKASEARYRANESAKDVGTLQDEAEIPPSFSLPEDIKGLFREIAKKLHPDLATNDKERERRTKFMAEANAAYQAGDENRLKAILEEWETSPDVIEGDDLGSELIRLLRRIAQGQRRISSIESEINQIIKLDIYVLYKKAKEESNKGRDILSEMATSIEIQILEREALIKNL